MTAQTLKVLTIAETLDILRSYGMKISQDTLEEGIKQGAYDFGVCIQLTRCVFQVYEAQLIRWISERCVEEKIPEVPREFAEINDVK